MKITKKKQERKTTKNIIIQKWLALVSARHPLRATSVVKTARRVRTRLGGFVMHFVKLPLRMLTSYAGVLVEPSDSIFHPAPC